MIYLSIKGRLGNQLFQYAFARALKEKTGQPILIDWHHCHEQDAQQPDTGFHNSLKDFNVEKFLSTEVCDYKKYMSFKQQLAFRKYERNFPYSGTVEDKEKFETDFLNANKSAGLFFFENGYFRFDDFKMTKNIFLNGFFESEKYFKEIEDTLKKEFTPVHQRLEHNNALYEAIENSESVCVTVRRGDFLNSSFHDICSTEYFLTGMDIIKKKVPNAKFFIFSDDIQWLKDNVDFKYPVTFEKGNDPVWEKLRLMYSCKHFIISNSTFSWWAQYLSRNPQKIVVSPDRWFNSSLKSDLLNNDRFIKLNGNGQQITDKE